MLPTACGAQLGQERCSEKVVQFARSTFEECLKCALMEAGFHVMRRTHATLMNEIHDDPKMVAGQLGHTLDVSQNLYTRASVERRKSAVDALEIALPAPISALPVV